MKSVFKSSDFIFRQTALGAAFAKAGISTVPMAREPKHAGLLRQPNDRWNQFPSKTVHLKPVHNGTPGAFGKRELVNA